MMNPTQALDAQRDLYEFTVSPFGHVYLSSFVDEMIQSYGGGVEEAGVTRDGIVQDLRDGQERTLREAQTYAVADDMLDLVEFAARSLPPETVMQPEDLPSPHGFVLLPRGMGFWDPDDLENEKRVYAPIRAIAWSILDDEVMVFWYTATADLIGMSAANLEAAMRQTRMSLSQALPIKFGCGPAWVIRNVNPAPKYNGAVEILRFIMAFWHLSMQIVSARETHLPERHAAKRFTRATDRPSPTVTIVCLRRQRHPDSTGSMPPTCADPTFHHRWLVRGHWRQQPYGPGRAFKRPVWIAPFVKGPDDAPLKLHSTVNYLVQ